MQNLLEGVLAGKHLHIGKAITLLENNYIEGLSLLNELLPRLKNSVIVGITGPPGAGKSSLINKLVPYAVKDFDVGILAVDPTSPFTRGALLGDRLRMNTAISKYNVYMRSMASKLSRGGISPATLDASLVLSAAGKDLIFIETVGVGQVELDIAEISDIVIVVLVPTSGDSIQAMKAGLMEIADLFVVNKADLDGADRFQTELEMILQMRSYYNKKVDIPVIPTVANVNKGVKELWDILKEKISILKGKDIENKRRDRLVKWLFSRLLNDYYSLLDNEQFLIKAKELAIKVVNREFTLQQAKDEFFKLFIGGS